MTVRDAATILARAAEGGAFEGLSPKEVGRRSKELIGGDLPAGLRVVDGWAEAVRAGWQLAGKLGGRAFLAKRRGRR